jgi:hypothetical protein
MTGLSVHDSRTGESRPPDDLRRTTRCLLALILPIGPFAVAVLRYVLPYNTVDSQREIVRKVAADPGRQSLVLWLGLVAILTLVPAVLAVGRLTRRRAPRTTAAALLLLVPGYLALGLMVGQDMALWMGVKSGLGPVALLRLSESSHPIATVADAVFVVGHVGGTVLLGIALWRSGVVPRWTAVMTVAAQPLHFIAAVIVASHTLDLVAWGMNAVAFGVVAVAVLHTPDNEWDLPPATAVAKGG